MPARKPEECDSLLLEALTRGELETAVALYEPNASFVEESGEVAVGREKIREILKGYIAIKGKFTVKSRSILSGDGSLALTGLKWSATGTDADGKPITMSGNSTEVVRRQSDGTWLFVIDNPHGAENPA
jgi:ketosteroid isomerase-like protein